MDIKEIINQRYVMPDASLDRLRQCLSEVSYPKGFRVLENGKIEKDIFFIKNGIVRAYTSVDGKEITFWVGKEGATLVSMKGYVNDEPGYETMELMEDSVLYVLKKKKLKELFTEDLHIANWGRRYADRYRGGRHGLDRDIRLQGADLSHPSFLSVHAYCFPDRIENRVILKGGRR
jgi:signal-transduction protein with cAMP-binding, CBS, and nucleotidyltransferase domain